LILQSILGREKREKGGKEQKFKNQVSKLGYADDPIAKSEYDATSTVFQIRKEEN
jgi:hypothetical protein